MTRRLRPRRVLKWIGVLACLLLAGLWCRTYLSPIRWRNQGSGVKVLAERGQLTILWWTDCLTRPRPDPMPALTLLIELREEMECERRGHAPSIGVSDKLVHVVLPLWLLLAALLAFTTFFWRLDRRRIPPGHCPKCGYNLTGNVSGQCSECGEPVARRRDG